MPELPEVETIRAALEPILVGRTIVDGDAHPSPKFAPAPEAVGARVDGLRRRGKYLLADLIDPEARVGPHELVVHLGMTGRLATDIDRDEPYVRAWWVLDDGCTLVFRDVRRFGRIAVLPAGDHRSLPTLHALGPEPFDPDFTSEVLRRGLSGRRAVKTQLLSQRPVAGVGNIYADEALWDARIHPAARRIGPARAARLHTALRQALARGLANGGTTLRDYRSVDGGEGRNQHSLRCYGRAGQDCLRCGAVLRSAPLDARTTTWCPRCQAR